MSYSLILRPSVPEALFIFQSIFSLFFSLGNFYCRVFKFSDSSVLFCCWVHVLRFLFQVLGYLVLKFPCGLLPLLWFCVSLLTFLFVCLSFICFRCVCSCSLKHSVMAFKVLFGNCYLCHASVLIYWLSFLLSLEMFLVLAMLREFLLFSAGHFGYYIMRFQILFKYYVLVSHFC